jgi:two-component system, chemotaxis family, chemotaxis protein CheY
MQKPSIIIVDDQRDVLTAIRKDLSQLEEFFILEECESANEAMDVLEDMDAEGNMVVLIICDHIMSEQNGVDFLIELKKDNRFKSIKKLLLTGLATHKDTIAAINMACIDRYIEKPWDPVGLIDNVKVLITQYLLHSGVDHQPFLQILDQETLYQEMQNRT